MSTAHKNKSIQKIACLFLLLVLASFQLRSQETEGEESTDKYGRDLDELTLKKRGPNLDRYGHLFIGYGFIVGPSENDSAQTIPVNSSTFTLGWLSKWRINRWYELGFDVDYQYSSYKIEQDSFKLVPNNTLHKKEKLVFNRIEVAPFQRFKFRNRYHSTGTFLDMGVFFGYNYRIKHQTVEKDRVPGADRTRTVNLGLNYTQDFNYGLMARIGFNRFIFFARYRFSDLFTEESELPELPRYSVGLKIGIHQ
ncbi:MAG: hypothetical protein CMP59_09670 [Flavobacteriales bacterium]|nr:hypothetical protein [Flavobacteriales bacterium]